MARKKSYKISANLGEAGLRKVNELKAKAGLGWDAFILAAIAEKYGVPLEELLAPRREPRPKNEKLPKVKVKQAKAGGGQRPEMEVLQLERVDEVVEEAKARGGGDLSAPSPEGRAE